LLKDPKIPQEDKQKIQELIKKPWNPYIRRHSALTHKSKILKEHTLRQYAGWTPRSNMPQLYIHYLGNEAGESLLEAYGITPKDTKYSNPLKPKQCPNCNEPNIPNAKFCVKCMIVLTYDSYNEMTEEKEKNANEVHVLRTQFNEMQLQIQMLISSLGNLKNQNEIDLMAKQLFKTGLLHCSK
jgi:hypothetical protein